MPYQVFPLERFSADENQDSRMFNLPRILRGSVDHRGGVASAGTPAVTTHNWHLMGKDWLGHSLWFNPDQAEPLSLNDGDVFDIRGEYNQSDLAFSHHTLNINFNLQSGAIARFRGFIPGSYALWLVSYLGTGTDVRIPLVVYHQDINGNGWRYGKLVPSAMVVGDTADGNLPQNITVKILCVGFERATNGLFPYIIEYREHTTTHNNARVYVRLSTAYVWKVYFSVAGIPGYEANLWYVTGVNYYPDRAESLFDGSSPPPPVSFPWFYPGAYDAHPGYPGSTAVSFARGRTWHIQISRHPASFIQPVTYAPHPLLGGVYMSVAANFIKSGRDTIFYSDVGFLGFSDTYYPNYITFDDQIYAVTPSPRGIYVYSELGVYEAYGDFASASGTRVDRVPLLSGIDFPNSERYETWPVAYSGEVAYAVKERSVYQIGVGGVKQVGLPVSEPDVAVKRLYYDRNTRELFVHLEDGRIFIYDAKMGVWRRATDVVESAVNDGVLIRVDDDLHRTIGADVDYSSPTSTGAELLWEGLDFGRPLLRKKLSRILIPNYQTTGTFEVYIRRHGDPAWLPCVVLATEDGIEARCPSVVARKFDIRVALNGEGIINPPLVFVYEVREKGYEQN